MDKDPQTGIEGEALPLAACGACRDDARSCLEMPGTGPYTVAAARPDASLSVHGQTERIASEKKGLSRETASSLGNKPHHAGESPQAFGKLRKAPRQPEKAAHSSASPQKKLSWRSRACPFPNETGDGKTGNDGIPQEYLPAGLFRALVGAHTPLFSLP